MQSIVVLTYLAVRWVTADRLFTEIRTAEYASLYNEAAELTSALHDAVRRKSPITQGEFPVFLTAARSRLMDEANSLFGVDEHASRLLSGYAARAPPVLLVPVMSEFVLRAPKQPGHESEEIDNIVQGSNGHFKTISTFCKNGRCLRRVKEGVVPGDVPREAEANATLEVAQRFTETGTKEDRHLQQVAQRFARNMAVKERIFGPPGLEDMLKQLFDGKTPDHHMTRQVTKCINGKCHRKSCVDAFCTEEDMTKEQSSQATVTLTNATSATNSMTKEKSGHAKVMLKNATSATNSMNSEGVSGKKKVIQKWKFSPI